MFDVLCSMFPPSTMNDLRFALRQLLKHPGFTAVAVLTLALGIGANTAIFSFLNAILLRPLPYKDAERLVTLYENYRANGWLKNAVAAPLLADRERIVHPPVQPRDKRSGSANQGDHRPQWGI